MLALLAKYKLLVIVAALLGTLGVGGAGVAAAHGGLPLSLNALAGQQTHHANQATPPTGAGKHHNPNNGFTHGSVITTVNGAPVTYTLDAGQVSAISATSITLTRLDKQQVTLTISANTTWAMGARRRRTPRSSRVGMWSCSRRMARPSRLAGETAS